MEVISWIHNDIPPITKTILAIKIILTALVSLEVCSPFTFYFNYTLIVTKGQYWRLGTCLFYDGPFNFYFVIRTMFT